MVQNRKPSLIFKNKYVPSPDRKNNYQIRAKSLIVGVKTKASMYIILFYFFEGSLRFKSKGYDISKVVGLSKSKDKNYQCPRSRSLVFTNLLEVFRKLKQKSISYKLLDFCLFIIIFAVGRQKNVFWILKKRMD